MFKRTIFFSVFLILAVFSYVQADDYSSTYSKDQVGYDKFFDVQDEYRLVLKDNDLYVYDMEGMQKRRITHSSKMDKPEASFSKDKGYILYAEIDQGNPKAEPKYYRVPFSSDDNSRVLISKEEYMTLSKGK